MSGSAFKERKGQKPAVGPSPERSPAGSRGAGTKIVKSGRENPRAVETDESARKPYYNDPAAIISYRK